MGEQFDVDAVFNGDYELLHEDYLTSEQSDFDVEEILRLLPDSVHAILDAPCGWGRIANRLALLNFNVVGIDRSAAWIARAQGFARATSSTATFAVGDLATFRTPQIFDAVLCWFNSFGYGDDEWNAEVLEAFARAMRAGGTLLINTLDVASISAFLDGGVHEEASTTTDGVIVERSSFDALKRRLVTVRSRAAAKHDNGVTASVRLYNRREWTEILEGAGFCNVAFEPRSAPTNADAEFEVTVVATKR
jgi:SAM-dependent methyltransferase